MSPRGPSTPDVVADTFHLLAPGRDESFRELARAAFEFQKAHNPVYRRFCGERGWDGTLSVPYLPVAAFKELAVTAFDAASAERVFVSSATGSAQRSRHFVKSLDVYRRSLETAFAARFGSGPFTFVAHLPRYADQGESSSLLFMVDRLIQTFGDEYSGIFLDDREFLRMASERSKESGSPFVLFGAAFGLLNLVESKASPLPAHGIVIETGGMKMQRGEITRDALHGRLAQGFNVPARQIFSEYGMCEMLSQCYTRSGGIFFPPPWVRFRVVDPEFPDEVLPVGRPGALALFDLANVFTVCALLTGDRAVSHGDGFEVLGRLSGADLRGCNYLLASSGVQG